MRKCARKNMLFILILSEFELKNNVQLSNTCAYSTSSVLCGRTGVGPGANNRLCEDLLCQKDHNTQ